MKTGSPDPGVMTMSIYQIIDRQLKAWELEKKKRRTPAEDTALRPPTPPTITISRQYGSGGGELARTLAGRLGYQVFDHELLDTIAGDTRFRKATLESLDEGTLSTIHLWVEALLRGRYFDEADYHKHLLKVLLAIAEHGKAVILGRGASFVVKGERVVKIRIVAPEDVRVNRVAEREDLASDQARRRIQLMDQERAAFVRRHFGADVADPTAYHAILNSGDLSLEMLTDLVQHMVEALEPCSEGVGG